MAGESSEELNTELEALEAIYSGDEEFTEVATESSKYLRVINIRPSNLSIGLEISISGKHFWSESNSIHL